MSKNVITENLEAAPQQRAHFGGESLRKHSTSSVMLQKKQEYLFKSHIEGFRTKFKQNSNEIDDGNGIRYRIESSLSPSEASQTIQSKYQLDHTLHHLDTDFNLSSRIDPKLCSEYDFLK